MGEKRRVTENDLMCMRVNLSGCSSIVYITGTDSSLYPLLSFFHKPHGTGADIARSPVLPTRRSDELTHNLVLVSPRQGICVSLGSESRRVQFRPIDIEHPIRKDELY